MWSPSSTTAGKATRCAARLDRVRGAASRCHLGRCLARAADWHRRHSGLGLRRADGGMADVRTRTGHSYETGTVAGMVIELSRSVRPSAPVSASLAGVLADPNLRIAMCDRDADWRDEFGQPIQIPYVDGQTGQFTIVPVPVGGQLALLHGPAGRVRFRPVPGRGPRGRTPA